MSKIAVIGAGKTGRGFLGRLLKEAGMEFLLVDKNEALVERMNEAQQFRVSFFGNKREAVVVDHYQAHTWETAPLRDAELIFVSVCGQNLPDVGARLAEALDPDRRYAIITCENASHPAQTLKAALGEHRVCVSEATVFCTTIEADGLNINSENYPYLQCSAELLEGYIPDIPSVRPIENFSNFLTRKLYTYNAASCVIAYLGALLGYSDYGEAANDPLILQLLDRNYLATNGAMCKTFGYDPEDQREFAALSKAKFCDRTIIDTIARNAREPHRKLKSGERLIGAAKLLRQCGEDASVLELTAAAALIYKDPADLVWTGLQRGNTPCQLLSSICGLEPSDPMTVRILSLVQRLEEAPRQTIESI